MTALTRERRPSAPGTASPEAAARPKVLVVDDQQSNLIVAQRILKDLPVEVLTATSGPAALALVLRNEFAVILLDVRMPDMDGYETATLIRDHTARNPVPIVFLTASEREEEKMARGYESGAVDYLYKPVDDTLLRAKVGVFLELYQHRQQLQQMSRALRQSNQQMTRLLQAVGEGIVGIEADGRIGFVNHAACRLLDASPPQLLSRGAVDLLSLKRDDGDLLKLTAEKGFFRDSELTLRSARGRAFPAEISLAAVESEDGAPSYVLVFQDIAERKAAAEKLRQQAELDHLTGLSNRLMFERCLQQRVDEAGAGHKRFALLFLDLDGFKLVNDAHGHAVGDYLLRAVAARLRAGLSGQATAARIGGDEFAVILGDVDDVVVATRIARSLIERIVDPYDCGGLALKVGVSVGVAMYPEHGDSSETVIRAGDLAMYQAKRAAGDSVRVSGSAIER